MPEEIWVVGIIAMRFLCKLGLHRVDRRHARFDGEVYRARCRRCGERMTREPEGWKPSREAESRTM